MNIAARLTTTASLALTLSGIALGQHYTQVNLVANTSGIAPVTDPQLVNPWGLSRSSGSPWWISDQGTGLSTLYNGAGTKNSLVVTIPKADPISKTFPTGTPTGTIANGSPTDFLVSGKPAAFLFATIDGTIAAWNPAVGILPGAAAPSVNAITVVKTTDGSSYTGLTSAFIDGKRYLYAANFTKGRVDVYDNAFSKVKLRAEDDHSSDFDRDGDNDDRNGGNDKPFTDIFLPRNFVPFNVQAIGNDIVVTYVLHQPGKPFETDGPGLGYVNIYTAQGKLVRRLQHGDQLNAPWGVALAPLDFSSFSHDLLIGQFAGAGTTENSGTIAAYDLATGKFDGFLVDATGKTISINGLWAISPANSASAGSYDPAATPGGELYFTAGTNGTGGLFGYLKPVATDQVKGNDQ
ncbi:TIGR03118 family protein [Granulicella arctica]|uniref:TIGR03118 family protein n=1 Tax=Granulicella arctica TaxID=940613 RepID=UPI0021E0392D|nr:TIGR03118 family protein [Granulicella arctica]